MKSPPFHRPETWKRCPFQVEPPLVGHYRECPPPPPVYQDWVGVCSDGCIKGGHQDPLHGTVILIRNSYLWWILGLILWKITSKMLGPFCNQTVNLKTNSRSLLWSSQKCINVWISLQLEWLLSNGGVGERRNSPPAPSIFHFFCSRSNFREIIHNYWKCLLCKLWLL